MMQFRRRRRYDTDMWGGTLELNIARLCPFFQEVFVDEIYTYDFLSIHIVRFSKEFLYVRIPSLCPFHLALLNILMFAQFMCAFPFINYVKSNRNVYMGEHKRARLFLTDQYNKYMRRKCQALGERYSRMYYLTDMRILYAAIGQLY